MFKDKKEGGRGGRRRPHLFALPLGSLKPTMADEKDKVLCELVEDVQNLTRIVEIIKKKLELFTKAQSKPEKILETATEEQNLCTDDEKSRATRGSLDEAKSVKEMMDEELKGLREEFHINVLFVAARAGRLEDLKYLIEGRGLPMSARNKNGENILYSGVRSGSRELTEYIIQRAPELKLDDRECPKVMLLALEHGHLDVIKYLHLQGTDVVANISPLPMHNASKCGYVDVLKYLHLIGLDIMNLDSNGSRPIHYASKHGQLDVVKYLCQQGADLSVKDKDNWTPLHIACANGHLDIIKYLHQHGVDLSEKTGKGSTSLHLASLNDQVDIVKYLHQQGVNLSATNNDKLTPLHSACMHGHLDIINYLHQHGADLSAGNSRMLTPLHYACRYRKLDAVKLLHELGADPTAVDDVGSRPVDIVPKGGLITAYLAPYS